MEILAFILIPIALAGIVCSIVFGFKAYKKGKTKMKFGDQELPEFEDNTSAFPSITINKAVDEYSVEGTVPNARKAKKLTTTIAADTYPCGGPVFCINKQILVQIQMSSGAVKYVAYIPENFDKIEMYEPRA